MGTYIPSGPRRRRSIDEALLEAEEDHFLDCPSADFLLRLSAVLLDAILCWIMYTGIRHTSQAFGVYLSSWIQSPAPTSFSLSDPEMAVRYVAHVMEMSFIYLYLVWSVSRYGGTPAKLLLGMRVVDANTGQRLSLPRAMFRELVGKAAGIATAGFGFGMAIVRDDKRAMHDLMAGSVVKKIHGGP